MSKKLLLGILIAAALIVSFRPEGPAKSSATVNRISGLYCFIECQPVADYQVLGEVKKTGLVWSGKAKEMRDILVKRAMKDYDNAEGIIFDDIAMDHATVIKFK